MKSLNSPKISSRGAGYVELIPGENPTSNAAMHAALHGNGGAISLDNITDDSQGESESSETGEAVEEAAPVLNQAAEATLEVVLPHHLGDRVPQPVNVTPPVKDNSCEPIWKVLRDHVAPLAKPLKEVEAETCELRKNLSEKGLLPGSAHRLIKKHETLISASSDPDEIISLSREVARLRALHPAIGAPHLLQNRLSAPQRAGVGILQRKFLAWVPLFLAVVKAARTKLDELEQEVTTAEHELFERFGFDSREATALSVKIQTVRSALSGHEETIEREKERCALPGHIPIFQAHWPELGL
jgi:hypothetical protein